MPPVSLILLPGLDGTGLLFGPLVKALPPAIIPSVVRYPGDRNLSYEELLPVAIGALPQSGPFILLGESFSGPLALMIAAKRPPGLLGVILSATFVTRPRRFIRPFVQIVSRAPAFQFYLPYKRLRARLGGFATFENSAMLEEMSRLVTPGVIASRVRMVFGVDAGESLRACDVPMLYLKSGKDWVVPHRNLRVIQQIVPDIKIVTIGSSHMLLQRHAAEAAEAIGAFAAAFEPKR